MCCDWKDHPINLATLEDELMYCQKLLLDLYNDKTITSEKFGNRLDDLENAYMKMKEGLCDMVNVIEMNYD